MIKREHAWQILAACAAGGGGGANACCLQPGRLALRGCSERAREGGGCHARRKPDPCPETHRRCLPPPPPPRGTTHLLDELKVLHQHHEQAQLVSKPHLRGARGQVLVGWWGGGLGAQHAGSSSLHQAACIMLPCCLLLPSAANDPAGRVVRQLHAPTSQRTKRLPPPPLGPTSTPTPRSHAPPKTLTSSIVPVGCSEQLKASSSKRRLTSHTPTSQFQMRTQRSAPAVATSGLRTQGLTASTPAGGWGVGG